MPKMHFAIMVENQYGGYSYNTLCGRESVELVNGDMNRTDNQEEVSCALCIQILADVKHWRHRKYLK